MSELKPRPTSVRLPEPLAQRLRAISEATGYSISEILIECAEQSLDKVARRLARAHKIAHCRR